MPLSGKQSAGSIPTHATPSIPNTNWEGAPEAGKLCVRLLRHRLVIQSLPHGSSALSCPKLHTCPSSPGAPPSHSPTLVKNWEQQEVAEKCYYCKKLSHFLPELFINPPSHASACHMQPQHRPTHLAMPGMLSLGHPGAASPTEHPGIPQSTALQTGCYMENKPRAETTGRVQPGAQKGSREQRFFLRSGCSRSQLLWSSYPGHNSSAVFPAAPGNTSSRKQQCVPWSTRLWSSSKAGWLAGWQALQSQRQHMHHSCPASSLTAGTCNHVLNRPCRRLGDPARQGPGRAAAGVYTRKALEAICHR